MRCNRFSKVVALTTVALATLALATTAHAAIWTPAEITTDLWLDAADASTVTQSGGLVSQWDDKSGNMHHATATSMPTYSNSSMLFDYGNAANRAFMTIPNHADLDIAGGKSIFTVYDYTTNGRTWSALLSKGSYSNQNGWALIHRTTTSLEVFTNYRESIAQTSGLSQDFFHSVVTDGSITKSWQNGGNEQSVTKTLVDNTTAEMVIGARNGNGGTGIGDQFTGHVNEIVMIDGALSDAGRQEMEGYLAWKWGLEGNLPLDHPYLSAAPTVGGGGPDPPTINLALGKEYAYLQTVPGQQVGSTKYYFDDPHAVHVTGLGEFSTGDLTDGVIEETTNHTPIPGPVVAIRGSGNAPAVDIVFDLEEVSTIEEIIVGTSDRNCCGNVPPDDVSVLFSTTGTALGDFGAPSDFTLWSSDPGPAHHEIALDIGGASARYVKLSFDGGVAYGGAEKYILDEITINGSIAGAAVPEPSTFLLAALGLLGLAWLRQRARRSQRL